MSLTRIRRCNDVYPVSYTHLDVYKRQDPETGVVRDLSEIGAVGHRIVHGGENFSGATRITPEVENEIAACSDLAPLHNPANLIGIRACEALMPGVPMVAVFDTAFHQTCLLYTSRCV